MSLCLLLFLEIYLFVANTIKEQLGQRWWPCVGRDYDTSCCAPERI